MKPKVQWLSELITIQHGFKIGHLYIKKFPILPTWIARIYHSPGFLRMRIGPFLICWYKHSPKEVSCTKN